MIMPSVPELERFRSTFRAVAGEAATLAARGEAFQDLPMPEAGMDADLASMLQVEESAPPAGEADAAALDFGAFLDSIPDNAGGSPSA
ncbi:MAG TPA: hypothetical protein DIC34_10935, partial [Treponema sp.]|nr:hypothetical protein [Treponema sp.]